MSARNVIDEFGVLGFTPLPRYAGPKRSGSGICSAQRTPTRRPPTRSRKGPSTSRRGGGNSGSTGEFQLSNAAAQASAERNSSSPTVTRHRHWRRPQSRKAIGLGVGGMRLVGDFLCMAPILIGHHLPLQSC